MSYIKYQNIIYLKYYFYPEIDLMRKYLYVSHQIKLDYFKICSTYCTNESNNFLIQEICSCSSILGE